MKKQIKRFLSVSLSTIMLFSALAVAPLTATAAESEVLSTADISGSYEYEMTGDGTVQISRYYGNKSEVTIPDKIEGKSVTIIGAEAFAGNETLKKVVIPDGVTSIYWGAFAACPNLDTITIPNSVTDVGSFAFEDTKWLENQPDGVVYAGKAAIGYKGEMAENTSITIKDGTKSISSLAFSECENITSVTMPDSLLVIGNGAFYGCTGITSVTIPSGVVDVSSVAFNDCTNLESIEVSSKNANYLSSDGVLMSKNGDGDTLIKYPQAKKDASYTVADTVKYIGYYSFSNNEFIKSVTIPDGVTEIRDGAFLACSSLESITIPDSVKLVSPYALNDTKWYENQPDGVVYAGKILYGYKGEMTEKSTIDIKDGTVSINNDAFAWCEGVPENLVSVTIPDSVTYIGEYAFNGCSSLESITIPDSITYVGTDAFSATKWLENQPDGVVYVGNIVYAYKGEMPANTSVTVKDGTKVICDSAFFNLNGLTEIKLPDSLSEVGERAFSFCENLKGVTIPAGVTTIGEYAFGYTGVMWSNAPLSRIDGFTITGYSGTEAERYANDNGFKFISLGTTKEPEILGDVDGDGKVNIKDVTMIQRTAASIITLSDVQRKFADVNKDGKVNVNDATAIQKYTAGIDTGLEIGK
ncbi:MAG: leucine-rich repeat protein [Acutalibacteraceae bacterium]